MKRSAGFKHLTGILCIPALVLVAATAVTLDRRSPAPILPGLLETLPFSLMEEEPPLDLENTGLDWELILPEEPPTEEAPANEEVAQAVTFPYSVPGQNLVIERLAPYSGMFVEDGSNTVLSDVAMILVRNAGDSPVEYAQLRIPCGQDELNFDISALPAGARVIVQEKNAKPVPADAPQSATATVTQRATLEMSADKVQVTDNGDNTLTIRNLTDQMLPTVRVFYKYYMEQEDIYIGGIAFTVRVTRLEAGESITIQPSHYTSQAGRVVMVLTYDSDT